MYCNILSPSISFTLIYEVIYIVSVLYVSKDWGDFNEANFAGFIMMLLIIGVLGSVTFFYILQHRELKRFFENREAIVKE